MVRTVRTYCDWAEFKKQAGDSRTRKSDTGPKACQRPLRLRVVVQEFVMGTGKWFISGALTMKFLVSSTY